VYKPSSAIGEKFGEIQRYLNRCDATADVSSAGLLHYSINRMSEAYRQDPRNSSRITKTTNKKSKRRQASV